MEKQLIRKRVFGELSNAAEMAMGTTARLFTLGIRPIRWVNFSLHWHNSAGKFRHEIESHVQLQQKYSGKG